MSLNLKQLMEEDAGGPVPPAPVRDVLAGGRSRLRRRRAVAVAAAVAAVVLAIAVPIGLTQGGSDDEPIEPPSRTLTFTREDGSTFTVDGASAYCLPPSETETESQAIVVDAGIDRGPNAPAEPSDPFFVLEVLLTEVSDGAMVDLPATVPHVFDGTEYEDSHLYAYDPATSNELSSSNEGARGTIVFEGASCDPEPSIDVTFDATLATRSEDGGSVRVEGTLRLGER